MFRLITYLVLTAFTYDNTCSVYARVERVSAKKSIKNTPSENNKYRTVKQDLKLKPKLQKFYARDLNEVFEDMEKDYQAALKANLAFNKDQNFEDKMQQELTKFLASKRDMTVKGVKNVEKESSLYMPPQAQSIMKQNNMTMASTVKNMNANFDLKSFIKMKDDVKNMYRKNRTLKSFREFDEFIAPLIGEMYRVNKKLISKSFIEQGTLVAERTGATRNPATGNTYYTNPPMVTSNVRTGAAVTRDYSSSGSYEDDEYDDEFLNPALEVDSQDKALASEQKGYQDHSAEKKAKENEAKMYLTIGMILIVAGVMMYMAGQKKVTASCTAKPADDPNAATADEATKDPEMQPDSVGSGLNTDGNFTETPPTNTSGPMGGPPADGSMPEGGLDARYKEFERLKYAPSRDLEEKEPTVGPYWEKILSYLNPLNLIEGTAYAVAPICPSEACPACIEGKSQRTMGLILIGVGLLLLFMGMKKKGEAAALQDQDDAQKKKNADIDAARKRIKDQETQQKLNEWKKIQYRKRQKQKEEQRLQQQNRQLQNAAQQAR